MYVGSLTGIVRNLLSEVHEHSHSMFITVHEHSHDLEVKWLLSCTILTVSPLRPPVSEGEKVDRTTDQGLLT